MYFLMKFQNYILVFAGCLLVACSNDDDPVTTIEIEPDATLSLMVDNGNDTSLKKTKAEITNFDNIDKDINSLTLAVFNQGAYEDKEMGVLVACKTVTDTYGGCSSVEGVAVHSGPVDVLVLGNLSASLLKELSVGKTTLSDITEEVLSANLKVDESVQLTMGSAVHRVILQSEKVNCMGYTDSEISEKNAKVTPVNPGEKPNKYVSVYQSQGTNSKIKLYRNVARIQLKSVKFEPSENYANGAELTINKLFVANVKSKTRLTSSEEWGNVEWMTPATDAASFWYCGQFADAEGTIKKGEATLQEGLLSVTLKEGGKDILDREYKDNIVSLTPNNSCSAEKRVDGVIGKTFYVYENREEGANHTLLVLCGTYKYIPVGQKEPVQSDVYYAVTVNKPGEGTLESGSGELTPYIKRNYNYSVNVNIKAPGAKDPYTPDISANLSTSVKVEPWNVVVIKEDVE
ncbi:hypothetical protein F090043F1_32530 [Parabacteroides goldsteinii]